MISLYFNKDGTFVDAAVTAKDISDLEFYDFIY
jgi:hypothetical protein